MNKKIHMLIVAWLCFLTIANAQVSGNYQYDSQQNWQSTGRNPASNTVIINDDEVEMEVNGLMNVIPDNLVAVFNIVQVGETIDSTERIMTRRIANFRSALKSVGIPETDMKVDMISFVPKFDIQVENRLFSKTYNEIPAGYELQKNVIIRYKNSEKLDDIVAAAASSSACFD